MRVRIAASLLAALTAGGIALAVPTAAQAATTLPATQGCFGAQMRPNSYSDTYYYAGSYSSGGTTWYTYNDYAGNSFDSNRYLGENFTVHCAS